MHKLIFNLTNILFLFSALSFLCVYAKPRNENFRPNAKNDISRYVKIKTRKCYHAVICVHTGREICGKSSDHSIRRFIDSCDMKEYNCLHKTDYRKTNKESCLQLPPIGVTEFYSENEPLHVERDSNSVSDDSRDDASKDSHSKDNAVSSQNESTEETEEIDDSTYDGREEKNKYVELNSDAEVKKYEADSSGGTNTENEGGSTDLANEPQNKATDKIETEDSEDNASNDKPDDQNDIVLNNDSSKQSDTDSYTDQNDKSEINKVSEQSEKDSDKNENIQTNQSSEQPGMNSDSDGIEQVPVNRSSGKSKTKSDKNQNGQDAVNTHPRKSNNRYENHGF